jgi:PAS domain S-box-containing protein
MTALAETAGVISLTLDPHQVFQLILRQVSQLLDVEMASLALIDPGGQAVEFRASTISVGEGVLSVRLPLGSGIAGSVAQSGQGMIVSGIDHPDRHLSALADATGVQVRAVACAPIRLSGQVIGVMEAINPRKHVFNQDALKILSGVGSLAGTAIMRAQLFERLQAAHQRYRDLFQDSIDAIFLSDLEGKILEANRQAELVTGRPTTLLRGSRIQDLHPVDDEKMGHDLAQLASSETCSYESRLTAESGQAIPVQVYVRKVALEEGETLQWTFHDITERKNLDNLRDDLLSMVYHDLRSPLGNILSSLEMLGSLAAQQPEKSVRSLVQIAARSADRIQRLTDSLLDIQRLEAGQPIVKRQPVLPMTLVSEALEIVLPLAQSKRQSLENQVPTDLPAISVDGDMIRRVIINLLENAIKYCPLKAHIETGARVEGDDVRLWIKDDGPGIPDVARHRIFEKYTRLQIKDAPRGLGLGLAFCRLAVEGHGGRIWFESVDPHGSSFIMTFPVASSTLLDYDYEQRETENLIS